MAQSLYTLPNIVFVAGRRFSYNGVTYDRGDVVPEARAWRNVEAAVRSRHVYLVVKDKNDVPVYFQKDVMTADLLEKKAKFTIKWPEPATETTEVVENPAEEPEGFDPAEHTIPEVLEYVGEDQGLAEAVLEAEVEGKNRSTLVASLEELATAPEEE